MTISWPGSTPSSTPLTIPNPLIGSPPCERPCSDRCVMSMGLPTRCSAWHWPIFCWPRERESRAVAEVGGTLLPSTRSSTIFCTELAFCAALCRPPYGPLVMSRERCVGIIDQSRPTSMLDSSTTAFPATFPRFVQHAIWRYCAANGLNVCNGNRIDDDARCDNTHCQLFRRCDRIALRAEGAKVYVFQ